MPNKLSQLFNQLAEIARLPVVRLQFRLAMNPEEVEKSYKNFTKPHPKYKIFRNKSVGAALVDLTRFRNRDEYLQTIMGRNSAEHHARKARGKGYVVVEIDRNDFIDDIYEINNSVEVRQGRVMDAEYREKKTSYRSDPNFKYFGVLNAAGKLVAYGELGFYGNFAAFQRVIGVRNNDGMMHLMMTEIVCQLIEARSYQYLMYDTYFGASPGMKTFKKMLGFQPYRAKYSIL
jgi:L-amino acid N-acyltransferase YncA